MNRRSEQSQTRVYKWLKGRYPVLTQRQIEEALDGRLVVDFASKPMAKGDRMPSDAELNCAGLDFHLRSLKKGNNRIEIPIVHDEADWLAIDKPAGVASHPLSLFDHNTVTQWATAKFPNLLQEFPPVQPTIVPHRLDTGTTGVLIVAKTLAAYDQWRKRFTEKTISKGYLAWCWGLAPEWTTITVDAPIAHDRTDRRRMEIATGKKARPPVLPASSQVEVVRADAEKKMVLCRVTCSTGVTHQVRVHLASLGLPLVGDSLYDDKYALRTFKPDHHQLRAEWLRSELGEIRVDTTAFIAGF